MDDVRFGTVCRAVRIQRRQTQAQVAAAAGVSRWQVSRLERGDLDGLSFGVIRRIALTLEGMCELSLRWRGPQLERLVNAAHAALQAAVLRSFDSLDGWVAIPEVTYSIYGERGAIDVLAWHEATRTLLVIELKTILVEAADLARTMDGRMRNAQRIGAERGWQPLITASWVIMTDTRTNRRHVRAHREILRTWARIDGRQMRSWLRSPSGSVAALSFWDEPAAVNTRRIGTHTTRRTSSHPAP
jgi:transcriptional regulator with XRE-family HTH domain